MRKRAEDLSGNPAQPIREGSGYVLAVRVEPKEGAFFTLSEDLGWDLRMLRRLDALRKILAERPARLMDTLLARLIKNADRGLQYRNSSPAGPHENFHLKLETPGPDFEVHSLRQRIEAHSALGIADRRASGKPDPEI